LSFGSAAAKRKATEGISFMTTESRQLLSVCEYEEKAECAETISVRDVAEPRDGPSKDERD
jgi:hypothetical protein